MREQERERERKIVNVILQYKNGIGDKQLIICHGSLIDIEYRCGCCCCCDFDNRFSIR